MKKAPITIIIVLVVIVPGLLYRTFLDVGAKSEQVDGFTDERPSSFSMDVGDRAAPGSKGILKTLRAGLSLFGLVPQDDSTQVLQELMEEYHSQVSQEEENSEENEDDEKSEEESEKEELSDKQRRQALRFELDAELEQRRADRAKPEGFEPSFLADGGGGGGGAFNPTPSPHQSYMNDNLPEDVEGWVERIRSQRSFKVFTHFVALFQVGHLSPDVFYPVVRTLLQDNDLLLVKYGVLALTGAPETESFVTLVESRNVVIQDPEILQLLSQGLSAYAEPTQLPHLFVVLRHPDRSEDFQRAVEIAEISLNTWYTPDSAHSGGVYSQLQLSLREGLARPSPEDLRSELQRLLDLMDTIAPQDDLLARGLVSY